MRAKWRLWLAGLVIGGTGSAIAPAWALPPATDIPEEVLRTEIITEARSPIDGKLLTAKEYAELEAQIQEDSKQPPEVAPRIRQLVGLLRLRRTIRSVFPFLLR
ncbi:MAG TPA: hypothetical protein V6C57_22245 [Coleofasciculaceae cyanobacterium]